MQPTQSMTPGWLFDQAGIKQGGMVKWGQPVTAKQQGVYIVTVENPPQGGQHIVYIGRAKSLSKRIRQFYRHKQGKPSPHSGGQRILGLNGPRQVHWAVAEQYSEAERKMLEAFRSHAGGWPFGNLMKSARMPPCQK